MLAFERSHGSEMSFASDFIPTRASLGEGMPDKQRDRQVYIRIERGFTLWKTNATRAMPWKTTGSTGGARTAPPVNSFGYATLRRGGTSPCRFGSGAGIVATFWRSRGNSQRTVPPKYSSSGYRA